MTQQGEEEEWPSIVHVDGPVTLDDPIALLVAHEAKRYNCKITLDANAANIAHFKQRAKELNCSPADVVIVILNIDDCNGGQLAQTLMPRTNWQEFRAKNTSSLARGLARKQGIAECLDLFEEGVAADLRAATELCVVVVDYDTAAVFPA